MYLGTFTCFDINGYKIILELTNYKNYLAYQFQTFMWLIYKSIIFDIINYNK